MNCIHINANTLPDSWFQLVYSILDNGREFIIDRGSYAGQKRLEFDYVTINIAQPFLRDAGDGLPLIPIMPDGCNIPPPTTKEYLIDYIPYIMSGEIKANELYTYGSRLGWTDFKFDQVKHVINNYKKYGHRNNQLIMQVAYPDDLILSDPPCLRHIDTRIQDNKLHFYIYFRSWDLWGGYPSNLAGLSILQEYMASEIGVGCGEFVCSSKGLHLYDYVIELAKLRCGKR